MNKEQQYLLEMLKEIDSICRANHIDYAVTGGTLIGAVRNGGFLPWDDDADIMMTRDNYLKFRKACKTQLPANRFLRDPETCDDYWHIIPRYARCDTTAFHTCQALTYGDVAGMVIDIFVLDPIADGDETYNAYLQDLYLYESVVNYSNVAATRVELDPDLCRKYLEIRNEQGRAAVTKLLEERLVRHFSSSGRFYAYRWQSVPYKLERSWFTRYTKVPFEDTELSAPAEINAYLTNYFGEDWTEIPRSITPAKHNAAASLDFPYTQALDYYHPKYDRAELHRAMDERKLALLESAPTSNALKDQQALIKAKAVECDTREAIAEHQDLFDRAYEARDGKTLATLLGEYLSYQTSATMIGRFTNGGMYRWMHPLLVDVDERTFEAALVALLHTDRIRFIVRLVNLYERAGHRLTSLMADIRDGVLELRAIMDLNQRRCFDESSARASKLAKKYPGVRLYEEQLVESLAHKYAQSGSPQDRLAMSTAISGAESRFPQDGLFMKFEADLLLEGHEKKAQSRYLQAAEHTRNGIALSDIARRTGYWPSWLRTPAWAKDAGVPQWSGPEPQPLANSTDATEAATQGDILLEDGRKSYLLGLLSELAAACRKRRISYVVSPALAKTWLSSNHLSASESAYEILLANPKGFKKLVKALQKSHPENRALDTILTDPTLGVFEARWYGEDSLRLPLKARNLKMRTSMFVTVRAVENEQPSFWTLATQALATGKTPSAMTKPQREQLDKCRRKEDDKAAARQAFLHACREKLSGPGVIKSDDECTRVPNGAFADTRAIDIAGAEFSVPQGHEAYLAAATDADNGGLLKEEPGTAYCYALNYDGLRATGVVDDEFYERERKNWSAGAHGRATMKKFRFNFNQLKYAVRAKEIASALIPRKDEIAELHANARENELKSIFEPWHEAEKKFKKMGRLHIDPELDEIYRSVYR